MSSDTHAPAEIKSFCRLCSETLETLPDYPARIEFIRKEMPRLLLNKPLMTDLMRSVADGGEYPDARRPTMFDNEVPLFIDPNGVFSLRFYLWGPGEHTKAHDHNSWGVFGAVTDGFEVIDYAREDDGSREGYARIRERARLTLRAGETGFTLPFDEGIHKTGNPGRSAGVTLHLYGRSLGRGFINSFDPENDRVVRILPPRRKKEYLAARVLEALIAR